MTTWLPIVVLAVVLALWALSRLRADPMSAADRAASTGDLTPLLTTLHRVAPAEQPTEYHRVLRRLWDDYHREEAVTVAKDLATHHRKAPVAQYWIQRFLQNEPELATTHLDEEFLAAFYDPAVAATCGSFG